MSIDETKTAALILAMERGALERWGRGDPSGFLDIVAPDAVYFDPFTPRRLDGREALSQLYESIRGQINIERDEIIDAKVQVCGECAAVLTFNYVSEGSEGQMRWNCTEVYRRDPEGWRIIQTHWSIAEHLKA